MIILIREPEHEGKEDLKMFDVITIGSATIDSFVESDSANVVSVSTREHSTDFMSYPYGAKVEVQSYKTAVGGGGLNAAANFAHLGVKTAAIFKIGEDFQGKNILAKVEEAGVDTSLVVKSSTENSGSSVILLSFEGNRTVLAYRGANGTLKESEIDFEAIKNAKWLYIAPLNGQSGAVLDKLAHFAEEHNTNVAINPGSSSLKRGLKYFEKILATAEVVVMNKEEASLVTKIEVRPDTKSECFSSETIHPDIKTMLDKLKSMDAKVVIITDGKNGVYAFDGEHYYKCPEFPAKVVSTLGAGDALSSTFTAALEYTNWNIEKSLMLASVNAASVVSNFGAQEGFLTFEEMEESLKAAPAFRVEIV